MPPPRIPLITARVSSVPIASSCHALLRAPAWSAVLPGGLRVQDGNRTRVTGRQDLDELAVLPLEDEGRRRSVPAERVELHRALHRIQRDRAVQVGDDLGVVEALSGDNGLLSDLD